MKIENEELCDTDRQIPTNDRWVSELHRCYRGAVDIVLQHHADPKVKSKGFTKIQRIQLSHRPKSDWPKDDFDEVVDALARSAFVWMAAQHEEGIISEDDAVSFSIQVRRSIGEREMSRNRVYFTVSLDGTADDPWDDPEMQALSELERKQQQLVHAYQSTVETQRVHIENVHEALLRQAEIGAAPTAALADMMQHSGSLALQGMTALVKAWEMQFADKKAEAEQRETTRRHQMWLEGVGKHVLPNLPALGAVLVQKLTGSQFDIPPPQYQDEGDGGDAMAEVDQQFRDTLQGFSESLSDEQWSAIEDVLSREEGKAFRSLLRARGMIETFERMQAFIDAMEDFAGVLGELQGVLQPNQLAIVMNIYQAYTEFLQEKEAHENAQQ